MLYKMEIGSFSSRRWPVVNSPFELADVMFNLSSTAIDVNSLREQLTESRAGALATFEGWVRNHNGGRQVNLLEYEAFEALAVKESERIIEEARARFQVFEIRCVHRVGKLAIGDLAVWVGATSVHREAAFQACRYVIDEIKSRVPIWKKEHYSDGSSEWVNCAACHAHAHQSEPVASGAGLLSEREFYARQMILPQVGESGQARLKHNRVLVIGAGGLGASALQYLAAAGVGTIGICEYDLLETSNLHRQVIYDAQDVGKRKTELAAEALRRLNPYIATVTYPILLDRSNAAVTLGNWDIVVDCTDNFDTKFLINDTCVSLGLPLVQASIYQWEGQIHVYDPSSAGSCLRCLWPETPEQNCARSCAEVGVLGAVPGVFGALQAMEALKLILGLSSGTDGNLILLNLLTLESFRLKQNRAASCSVCSRTPVPTSFTPGEHLFLPNGMNAVGSTFGDGSLLELKLSELSRGQLEEFEVIDVREEVEVEADRLPRFANLPASGFPKVFEHLSPGGAYLFFCQQGIRSKKLAQRLKQNGFLRAFSVFGGVNEVRRAFLLASPEP
jgi:sulfur-carrier protein adenylyltransferase/sulfurtransferase